LKENDMDVNEHRGRAAILGLMVFAVACWAGSADGASLPILRQFPAPGNISDGMTFVNGNLWVWDVDKPNTFYVMNPDSGAILSSYPSPPTGGPTGLAFDGQFVWGVSGDAAYPPFFAKFDSTNGSLLQSYEPLVRSPTGITYDGQNLWISEYGGNQIVKLDPITLSVIQTVMKPEERSDDLAWDGAALWLAESVFQSGRFISFIDRIDPTNGQLLARYDPPGVFAGGLDVLDNQLFVSDPVTDMIYVVSLPEPTTAFGVAFSVVFSVLRIRRRANTRCPFVDPKREASFHE